MICVARVVYIIYKLLCIFIVIVYYMYYLSDDCIFQHLAELSYEIMIMQTVIVCVFDVYDIKL